MSQETSSLLVRMPAEIYEALRKAAFEQRRTMTAIVNEAVQEWINKHPGQ